ncbi:MAG: T9SS type A sorting domain-containing protein [Bacteroidales bacterium]|nr:T9SS type A sorting domain-containing protein [Bacteroidales bacterium]
MKKNALLLILVLTLPAKIIVSQNALNIKFEYDDSTPVKTADGFLKYPWTGNFLSAQFSEIDANLDGYDDIVVFDRFGDRLLLFLYDDNSGEYIFSPQYVPSFPVVSQWMLTADYDNDGQKDIFTYTIGGIKVFKNTSSSSLSFQQVTSPFIKSYYNNVYTNILATSVDYPGIADIDGDGDLDILVFGVLGSYVEFHRNYSMETYGTADSLLFYKESECWGFFSESDESNVINLNDCPSKDVSNDPLRHTGSTFLLFDADGDGLCDLLLGDVDYPAPCILYNNGTLEEARIDHYSFLYPDDYDNIYLFSFPVMSLIDVDKDGARDLIVSTFDPAWDKVENAKTSWLYMNYGSDEEPNFMLKTKQFLQDEMINVGAGANPCLFDYDSDGDYDLFIGNWGYCDECGYDSNMILKCSYTSQISYWENIGTPIEPQFELVSADFAALSQYGLMGLSPVFFDVDADGDADLFCGNSTGTVLFFENDNDTFLLKNVNFLEDDLSDVNYSAPCVFDLNNDGFPDFLVGNERGVLSYYENEGSGSFHLVDDFFAEIDVRDAEVSWTGFSSPAIYESNDTLLLLVGSESGRVFSFYRLKNDAVDAFLPIDGDCGLVENAFRTSPALADLNAAGYPELVLGTFSGGVTYYDGVAKQNDGLDIFTRIQNRISIFPNPASMDIVRVEIDVNFLHGVTSLYVFDVGGGLVRKQTIVDKIVDIDISDLDKGVYIISIPGYSVMPAKLIRL